MSTESERFLRLLEDLTKQRRTLYPQICTALVVICIYQAIAFYRLQSVQAKQAGLIQAMTLVDTEYRERINAHEMWWFFAFGDHFNRIQIDTKTQSPLWPLPDASKFRYQPKQRQ